MAVLRASALRHIVTGAREPCLRGVQRRWAQVHDIRFVATHRQPDRVLEKYKEKLEKKAKEAGVSDIHELKEAFKNKIQPGKRSPPPISTSPFPPPPPPPQIPTEGQLQPSAQTSPSRNPPGIKTLSSFIDIPKTLDLPQKEIELIWRLRHASDPRSLCAILPYSTYQKIEATAHRHPQFILPLPREGQGAEIHFLQWTFPSPTTTTVLFTHLAEYKLRGEFSQPHTTVTHHLDLAGPKSLILLQGSVVEGRGVSVDEGKWLLMCLQKFYGVGDEKAERKRLLEQFSHGDGNFKVEALLQEAEKVP